MTRGTNAVCCFSVVKTWVYLLVTGCKEIVGNCFLLLYYTHSATKKKKRENGHCWGFMVAHNSRYSTEPRVNREPTPRTEHGHHERSWCRFPLRHWALFGSTYKLVIPEKKLHVGELVHDACWCLRREEQGRKTEHVQQHSAELPIGVCTKMTLLKNTNIENRVRSL